MDILKLISDKDRLDFSQNLSVVRNYMGDRLFPDIKTQHLEAEFYRLSDDMQIPTMAKVHAFDTEAAIGTRPALERVSIEKLLIKEKINQSERLNLLKANGVPETDMLAYIYDDMGRLAESVKTRTEVAKMELLQSGKIIIKENNLNLEIDYGVPSEHRVSYSWNSAEVDVLADIQAMIDLAKAKGKNITKAVTSTKIVAQLRKNKYVQTAIYGVNGIGTFISLSQINTLMMEMFGFTIEVNDELYAYETAAGVKTTKRYFDEDKFVLIATMPDQTMGKGLWGVTPEELKMSPWSAKSAQQFITLTQWETPDPVATWTKASGVFIPVLPSKNSLVIATINFNEAPATLGDLTVTSAAGANAGDTAITVEPAKASGNSYKYKVGASLTAPSYDQVISSGYTNWNGTDEITAATGQKIMIVEVDGSNKAKKVGQTTVTAKA